ncbi:hypothetical protein Tco_0624300, partial [Tanacetum coccineum]
IVEVIKNKLIGTTVKDSKDVKDVENKSYIGKFLVSWSPSGVIGLGGIEIGYVWLDRRLMSAVSSFALNLAKELGNDTHSMRM